jgi:hypothetical protein
MPRFSEDHLFAESRAKKIPFAFVLDELEALDPVTNPMFGCIAVYVRERIVFALRDRPTYAEDNGVWVATTAEHHASLREELPNMRSIRALGSGVTGWQVLAVDDDDFEEAVLRACALVRAGDPRIGKIPKPKRIGGPAKPAKTRKSAAKKKASGRGRRA